LYFDNTNHARRAGLKGATHVIHLAAQSTARRWHTESAAAAAVGAVDTVDAFLASGSTVTAVSAEARGTQARGA
jgi:hypothetical protein